MDAPNSPAPGGRDADGDPTNLHDLAIDIQTDLQKLATGLAHAGANPEAVKQLTNMAEVMAGVAKVLNRGPEIEQAAQSGQPPPPPAGTPQSAQPTQPSSGPGQGQPLHQPTLHAAAQGLHQMMVQAAQQRAAQQPSR